MVSNQKIGTTAYTYIHIILVVCYGLYIDDKHSKQNITLDIHYLSNLLLSSPAAEENEGTEKVEGEEVEEGLEKEEGSGR